MATITETSNMTGAEIIDLTKKHTLFEWSAQSKVDQTPFQPRAGDDKRSGNATIGRATRPGTAFQSPAQSSSRRLECRHVGAEWVRDRRTLDRFTGRPGP